MGMRTALTLLLGESNRQDHSITAQISLERRAWAIKIKHFVYLICQSIHTMFSWFWPMILLVAAFVTTVIGATGTNDNNRIEVKSPITVAIGFVVLLASIFVYFQDTNDQYVRDQLDSQVKNTVERIDSATNEVLTNFTKIDSKISAASDSIDRANLKLSNVLDEIDNSLIRNRELARAMNRQSNEMRRQFLSNMPSLIVYTDQFDTLSYNRNGISGKSLLAVVTNVGKREATDVTFETLCIYSKGEPTSLKTSEVFRTGPTKVKTLPPGSQLKYTLHDIDIDNLNQYDTGLVSLKFSYSDGTTGFDTTVVQYIKYTEEIHPDYGNFRIYQNEYKEIYNQMFVNGGVVEYFKFD